MHRPRDLETGDPDEPGRGEDDPCPNARLFRAPPATEETGRNVGRSPKQKRTLAARNSNTRGTHHTVIVQAHHISFLQEKQANTRAKIEERKRNLLELSHRILEVTIQQEIQRKAGLAIQTEEEQLRAQLEALNNQLRAPTQFRGLNKFALNLQGAPIGSYATKD